MAIQTQGSTGNVLEVDTSFKAARATLRPHEALSWNSIGAQTGGITGLAAAAPIFAFRNISANPILVRRVGLGYVNITVFTVAQIVDFGLMVARNWTVSDSGGTAIALTGSNGKHRTSLGTPTSADCRIAAAAALTAGTRTLDANTLSQIGVWSQSALSSLAAMDNLLKHDPSDYPLVLAQNEGVIIQNLTAMGAAGVGKLYVNFEFAEVAAY